mgnify:CR=1 FL=1|jgi:uncharacterized protein (TIGR02186 family)
MNSLRLILAALLLSLFSGPVWAAPVVADLSKYVISIDSGFTGTDVLLYGAVEEDGDLVVVVRGPPERVSVRRKGRVAGIWVNQDSIEFEDAPSYYMVASSRPLNEIAHRNFRELHQIGLDALQLTPSVARPEEEVEPFRKALVRNRMREGLYSDSIGAMKFLSNRLFSTSVQFPANVPEGAYRAEVFLIRDGKVISAETTPLFINKTGFLWQINFYAHSQPELYGILAILVALFAGWIAAIAFRKA